MTPVPTCKRCRTLQHGCYGLAGKACGQCQRNKKLCQDVVVKGEKFLVRSESTPDRYTGSRAWADCSSSHSPNSGSSGRSDPAETNGQGEGRVVPDNASAGLQGYSDRQPHARGG